ncbi:MAG TPA: 2-oxo acid dehydrogenase subunit E2, partial [Actinomycetota bacterium]
MTEHTEIDPSALGPNMWLVDEMYRRFRENPQGVTEAWREFFSDFHPSPDGEPLGDGSASVATEAAVEASADTEAGATTKPETAPTEREGPSQAPGAESGSGSSRIPEGAERIRFGAERIVRNMEASLSIPTATSFRFVPAKLLEENRRVINGFLAQRGKVSFTHLIGYAILRALEAIPVMKSSFAEVDGQ